mgnify:CR=1 FL=1
MLRLLRNVATLVSSVLFIPTLGVLFRWARCSGLSETLPDGSCWGGLHATIGSLVLLFVPIFIALCVFTQTVFIDRNPQSDMLGAKVQGRVEGVMILAKVMLVIAFTAVVDIIPPLATLAVCAATSALWVYLLAVQQPFIVPSMNDLRCGYGAIFAWGTVMAGYVIADPNTDLGIMTLLGVPLAFGLGWYLSMMYRESIAASPLESLTTWYDVDLWARYRIRLRDVLNKEAKRHGVGVAAVHDTVRDESALAVGGAEEGRKGRAGGGSTVLGEGGSAVGEGGGSKDKSKALAHIIRNRLGLAGGAQSDLLVGNAPLTAEEPALPKARSTVASLNGSVATAEGAQQHASGGTGNTHGQAGRAAHGAHARPLGEDDGGSDAASHVSSSRLSTAEGTDSQVFNKSLLRSRSGAASARSGTGGSLQIRAIHGGADIAVPVAVEGGAGGVMPRSASSSSGGGGGNSVGRAISALLNRSSSGASAGSAWRRDSDPSGGGMRGSTVSGASTGRSALAFAHAAAGREGDYTVGASGFSAQAVSRAVPSLKAAAARLMRQVEQAYSFSRDRFPTQGMAQLAAGQFYKHLHGTRYMEMVTIYNARRVSSAPDVRFFVYQRSRQLRETRSEEGSSGGGSGGGRGLTVIDRILFEQKWKTAREAEQACLQSLVSLWDEVRLDVPQLHHLEPLASQYWGAMHKALAAYRALLQLQSNNAKLLRAYAHFLTHFLHDSTRARQMLNKASNITAALTDAQHHIVEHLVMFRKSTTNIPAEDERVAVLKVDGERHSIGTLLHVNSAACRMFGRTRSQLLGRNMDMLLPPPIAAAHDTFLKSYARSGKGCLVNQTFYSFFADSGGNVVPCRVSIAEAPPSDTDTAPSFMGHIQRLEVAEDYVIFGPASTGYRMLAASMPSHLLLGTSAQKLADGNVSVCKHFEQVDTEHARVLKHGDKEDAPTQDVGLAELAAGLMSGSLTQKDRGGAGGVSAAREQKPKPKQIPHSGASMKGVKGGLTGLADVASQRRRAAGRGSRGGGFAMDSRSLGAAGQGEEQGGKGSKAFRRNFHSKISIAQSVASAAERRGRAKAVSLLRGDEFRSTPVTEGQNSSLQQVQAKVQTITLPVVGTFHVLIWKPMENTLDAAMDMSMLGGGPAAASRVISSSKFFQPPPSNHGGSFGGSGLALSKHGSFASQGSARSDSEGGSSPMMGAMRGGGVQHRGGMSGVRRLALNGSAHLGGSKRFNSRRLLAAKHAGAREQSVPLGQAGTPGAGARSRSDMADRGVAAGTGPRRRSVNMAVTGDQRSVTEQQGAAPPRAAPPRAGGGRDVSFSSKTRSITAGSHTGGGLPPSAGSGARAMGALGTLGRHASADDAGRVGGEGGLRAGKLQTSNILSTLQRHSSAPIREDSPTPPHAQDEGGLRRRSGSNGSEVSEPLTPTAHGLSPSPAAMPGDNESQGHSRGLLGHSAVGGQAESKAGAGGLVDLALGPMHPTKLGGAIPQVSLPAPGPGRGRASGGGGGTTPSSLFGSPAAIFRGRPRASSAAAASTGGGSSVGGSGTNDDGSARSSVGSADLGDFEGGEWNQNTVGLAESGEGVRPGSEHEVSEDFNPFSDSSAGKRRLSAADTYNAKRRAARMRLMGSPGAEYGAQANTAEGGLPEQMTSDSAGLAMEATFSLGGTNIPSHSLVGAFFTMGPRADAAAASMAGLGPSLASGGGSMGGILSPPSLAIGVLPAAPSVLPVTTGRNRSRSNTHHSANGPLSSMDAGTRDISLRSATGGGLSAGEEAAMDSDGTAVSSAVGSSLGGSDGSEGGLLAEAEDTVDSGGEGGAFLSEGGGPSSEVALFDQALRAAARDGSDSTAHNGLLDDAGGGDHAGLTAQGFSTISTPPPQPGFVGTLSSDGEFPFGGSRGDVLSASSSPHSADMAFHDGGRMTTNASSAPSDTDGGLFGHLGRTASPSASAGGWNSRGPSRLGLGGGTGAIPRTGRKRSESRHGGGSNQAAARATFKEGLRVLRRLAGQATMLPSVVLFRVILMTLMGYTIMTLPMILMLEVERQFVMPLLASLDAATAASAASTASIYGLSLVPDMLNPRIGAWAWSRPENEIVLGVLDGNTSLAAALATPSWWNNGPAFAAAQLAELQEATIGIGRSRLDVLGDVAERLDSPLDTQLVLEDGVEGRTFTYLSSSSLLGISVLDLINTPTADISRTQPAAETVLNNRRALGAEFVGLLQGYADVYLSYLTFYQTFYDIGCYFAMASILVWVLIPQYLLQSHLNRSMVLAVRNFALVPKSLVYQQQKTSKRRLLSAEKQLRKENGEDEEEEGKMLSVKALEAIKRSTGLLGPSRAAQMSSAYTGSSTRSGMLSSQSSRGNRRMSMGMFSANASSARNISLTQSNTARDHSAASNRGGGMRRLSQFSAAIASGRRQSTAVTHSTGGGMARSSRRLQLGGLQGAAGQLKSSRRLVATPASGEYDYVTHTHKRTWKRTSNIYIRMALILWLFFMKGSFIDKSILGLQRLALAHASSFSSSENAAAVHSILNSAFTNKTTGEIKVALDDATRASATLLNSLQFIATGSGSRVDPVLRRTMVGLPEDEQFDKARRLLTTDACVDFVVPSEYNSLVDCRAYVRSLNAEGRGLVGLAEEMQNLVSRLVATARVFPLAGKADNEQGIVDVREIVATADAGNADSAANRVGLMQILQSDMPYLRQQLQRVAREMEAAQQRERDAVIGAQVDFIIVSFTIGFLFFLLEARQSTIAARRAYAVRLLIMAVPKQMAFAVRPLLQQYHDFTEVGDASVRRVDGPGASVVPGQRTPLAGGAASRGEGGSPDERTRMLRQRSE